MRFRFAIIGLLARLIFAALAFTSLQARALPEGFSVPGGVAVVRIAASSAAAPRVWFRGHPVLVARDAAGWFALVGLPLDIKPGKQRLKVALAATPVREKNVAFAVGKKAYPEQHITITDTSKVEPNPEAMQRIEREQKLIDAARNHWDDVSDVDLALQLPVEGRHSGNFGLRRFFNGQPRSPHAGLDIAVPSGTPVAAAAAGTVIDIGDYFFNGNTVFIDHGQGLITMYCHLSEVTATLGEKLQRGQPFALSGMTGRATGPHLHWSVILNGALVDPAVFVGEAATN
jgi:murein DD-endopeptidase MepM/ murein hydrolase activator NlpD